MPILVVCPKCGANLNAPDSGAGKQVRCPKPNCGALVPVPEFVAAEAVEEVVEAVPAKPKPVRARAVEDDDDDRPRKKRRDDDDDDDDRPRKKRRDDDDDDRPRSKRRRDGDEDDDDRPRRRRKQGGAKAGVVVAIVLGSLLVLGGIGYGVYALVSGGGPKTAPPAGWKEYTYKDSNFKAYFPKEPAIQDMSGFFGGGNNPFAGLGGADVNLPQSLKMYHCLEFDRTTPHIEVMVVRFKNRLSSAERSNAISQYRKEQSKGESRSVRWMGESAEEVVTIQGVSRVAFVGDTMYLAQIGNAMGGREKPELENGFFDNCQLLK